MPELPEVETVVRGLRPLFVGQTIARCAHASPLMIDADSRNFVKQLSGRKCLRIDRQGKWIFCRLDGDDTLAIHLGMTGRLSVEPFDREILPHTHLRLCFTGEKNELRFRDPRRFGEILLVNGESFEERFGPNRLGPDALSIKASHLSACMESTTRAVKAVLLDQRSLAGVGNIYADEALYEARIHPGQPGRELTKDEIQRLATTVRAVLKRAIQSGGSTIRDYVDASGEPGSFQNKHRVYGREGKPCKRCRSPIELDRSIVSGRSTHWCRVCQMNSYQETSDSHSGSRVTKA
ncbi:bifunctional DNA-formamidopyrimidine glycosylase/DNA-(apurinic or apyrimidinic site) lyase [bacterium]|nr:bifunctional DNA-formamidopyrimidine glycosylase/DNA-(apurinic or apyrimidinic site) lyase [bacterium]